MKNTYNAPPMGGGGGGLKNMALGARFQKLKAESYYLEGLNSQKGLDS